MIKRLDYTNFVLTIQLILISIWIAFTGCQLLPSKAPQSVTIVKDTSRLSWEEGHPERKAWSYYLVGRITEDLPILDTAGDIVDFCPKYRTLPNADKALVWAELIINISKYESDWDPKNRYFEDTMGYYSEGLMQISVQDNQWYPGCKLTKTSILEPITNLDCAMTIFTGQIKKKGLIKIKKGTYWAVITVNHRNSKINQITAKMNALSSCRKDNT